ncbi:MAG: c-type cytochrome [Rhizobiaceae bacterium]
MRKITGTILFAACLSAASPALAEGDAVAGATVFNGKCKVCHDAIEEKDKIGPHLVGVVGRTAGTLESFTGKYSAAMVGAAAAGLVWDEANLAGYLRSPKEFMPGNRMAFAGLKDDADVSNVIAYLKAAEKPE